MASKTLHSNQITFIDLTDDRKLDVYITSNLPTTQLYNSNTSVYTPNWSTTNLQLSADVYLDSKGITANTQTTITWYKKVGNTKTQIGTGATKIISTNELSSNPIIIYVCQAEYQGITAQNQITFTRVDTGKNGTNGDDGTSVTIDGTAYYNGTLTQALVGQKVVLYSDADFTTPLLSTKQMEAGDSYIVQGYLCVYSPTDNAFICTGTIQGPKGDPGENAKSVVLSGDSQVFKVSKTNTIIPATITVTAQTINTSVTTWTYSTNGGQTFLSTVPTGVSRNGNIVTITGSSITSNSIVIKASDGEVEDIFTVYKAIDGSDGSKGNDGAPAPIAFLTNENVTFSANAQGQIATTTITSNIVAYNGTTKVLPTIGTITGAPTGMIITPSTITASNEIMLTITIANNSTLGSALNNMGVISIPITSPVSTVLSLTWSKVNAGATGVGVKSTTVTYGVSDSASTKPADTAWQSTIPAVADGKYLWTRTITDYTDDAIADTITYTYVKQGIKGDTGSTGSSVTVSSIQYQEGTSATIPPTSTWSNSIVAVDEGKFLWTKTAFSDGKIAYGVAKQGVKGDKGTPAVTFQLYAPNGYFLTMEAPSLKLQTFAYEGNTAITSGATFKWYSWVDNAWNVINGATSNTLTVAKTDVYKSKSYKCEMTYKNNIYIATATVEDKTDIYDSLINVVAKYSPTNKLYWVLYSTVYTEEGEQDELLGPVSITAPTRPTTGAYWYKIDEINYTVTLMKYSGTEWVTTTDSQELVYDWFLFNDIDEIITLGSQSKVKIVTSNDFSRVCSVQCNVSNSDLMPLTHNNQILNDSSDPIVSSDAPVNPINGQLWIKTGTNGIYTLLVWNASLEQWIISEADSQVKVHINKPTSYAVGDIWVVGSDYEPTSYINGVSQSTRHLAGTMLKAQYSSDTYKDSDWVEALNYKQEIDEVKDNLNIYNQYFSFDEKGIIMKAKNLSGQQSEFSTKLTNDELGFYQGENKVAYINNNQLNISKAEITNGMTIGGVSPILEIGNFAIIQESNGSLSIGLKS